VILGVEDPCIRKIEAWELDSSWGAAKYADMYFLEGDEDDEDSYLPVRVLIEVP
jgi:hypothetical protein